MPLMVLDVWQVTIRIPPELSRDAVRRLQRRLVSKSFQKAVVRAVRTALGPRIPDRVRVTVSR